MTKKLHANHKELICQNPLCGKTFKRNTNEINRSLKLNRKMFCSRHCQGKMNYSHLTCRDTSHLRNINRRDKYSGLREHLNRAKKRYKCVDICLEDMLEQWQLQEGKCVYTGLALIHPIDFTRDTPKILKASLDRIDSSLGYVKGNIQFISTLCNYAKNDISHEEMIYFCKTIADYWK